MLCHRGRVATPWICYTADDTIQLVTSVCRRETLTPCYDVSPIFNYKVQLIACIASNKLQSSLSFNRKFLYSNGC